MKSLYKVSHRYAKALFELAKELNKIDDVTKDITIIQETILKYDELIRVFRNPIIPIHKKINILEQIFTDKISELSLKFIKLILKKRRIVCLKIIANEYFQFYYQFHNLQPATLEVAKEIEDSVQQIIKQLLENITNKKILLNIKIKPELIGGFKLQWQDYVYDATIKFKLNLLQKHFQENIYKRKI